MGTSLWLKRAGKPARWPLALTIALGELSGILLIIQTALLVRIIDAVIFHHAAVASLSGFFLGLLAIAAGRFAVLWASRRAGFECASRVKRLVRGEIVSHLRSLGPVTLAGIRTGEVLTVAVDGVEALEGFYARYLPQRALSTLLPITVLACVFPLDWISGLTLLLTAVFLPVSMVLIGEESHLRNQRLWATLARMSGRFLDILQGLTTVRMFDAARREAAEIERTTDGYRTATMSVLRIAFLSSFLLELLSAVSIAIVAILSGLRLMSGTMQFAPAYFILLVAPEYFLVLRTLGTFYHIRMEGMSAAERIIALLGTPTASSVAAGSAAGRALRTPRHSAGEANEIAFEGVSFSYNSKTVLDGISFVLPAGSRAALAGPSGAGKSTVLAILLRFIEPRAGRVLVDGVPLGLLDPREWRKRMAWLPQKPTLFHGTIRDNIRLGRPGAGDADIENAAELACMDDFLCRLAGGLDTVVGEAGQGLSVGQAQRVALARLFLREPSLVLLDEPAAHLDPASAELVMRSIDLLGSGRTLLVATHRQWAGAERTLVLAGGKVREQG